MDRATSTKQRRFLVVAAAATLTGVAGTVSLASQREADRQMEAPPPAPPPEALAQTARDLDLPVSTSPVGAHAPDAVSVLVTRTQLLVGGDPTPIAVFPEGLAALATTGLPARFRRDASYHVPELGNELEFFCAQSKARGQAPAFAVLADASTPFSVLSEVLFTAASSSFERMDFAVRRPEGSLGWITLPLHTREVYEIWPGPAPDLFVTGEGFSLRWGRGDPAPGCDPRAAGAVVPKVAGAYDPDTLLSCLRRAHSEALELQHEARLSLHVSPAVDWQSLVAVLDVVRGTEAEPLFPEVTFAGGPHEERALPAMTDDERRALRARRPAPTGNAQPGRADLGGAQITGGTVTNASSVVAGMAAGFRRCYNKGLRADPNMKGSVRLTAKIGPEGEVLSVSPSGNELSSTVQSCLAARVSSAQFSPPQGGGATIVIPVTFTNK